MPRRSSAMSIDSLSVPGTETFDDVRRALAAPRPWIIASGTRARIAALEPIAQALEPLPLFLALGDRKLGGAREADDGRDVLRAGRRPRSCAPP